MEYEVRFYYPSEEIDEILQRMRKTDGLKELARHYEKTTQFDHPCADQSFYSKEIDGRFRIRVSKDGKNISKDGEDDACLLSWKRRLPNAQTSEVNKEEEIELSIKPEEYENLMFIVEKVLKMKPVESYERYRTRFVNEEVEIAVDEYPFGIAVEIEDKSLDRAPENNSKVSLPEEVVKKWVKKLGLNIEEAYRLSWDDKYAELCREQGIKQLRSLKFGAKVPKIRR